MFVLADVASGQEVVGLAIMNCPTKLEELPIMEAGRTRGRLMLEKGGMGDYESSDMDHTMCTELEEPVMESGRDKGRLVLGKRDYESSDVTVVAQQETVRE